MKQSGFNALRIHRGKVWRRRAALMCAALCLAAGSGVVTAAAPQDGVLGTWVTPGGKSHVTIEAGPHGTYAGRIVWLRHPDYPHDYPANDSDQALAGRPKVDNHNPDRKLRNRPILGLRVISGFHWNASDNAYVGGACYDPTDGKTYHCRMWLTDGGKELKLRGYVWIFYKTQTWRRLSGH
ncbi:DUF2147 domain-containing protein [Acidihalobacter ferrooxydans]|nr:DUF2147 domain-containing protein [Acidihalobacter ferrooxydans]